MYPPWRLRNCYQYVPATAFQWMTEKDVNGVWIILSKHPFPFFSDSERITEIIYITKYRAGRAL